ncbi:DNA repair and recombination protein RadB [Archaeoglobus veneficus]|uniref:DNA repair and recombination protein RadB n=1 Tax=Archaeoglobus veneficus (strain DSM 11195 / SNP6) TaxID=693661 RepID=F2KSM3_ARCVS|nr:DNA repair and recombination protein RadB [Archaeoglobus veneficus]AEA48093.1 DNA repair and recombination protein radB [Archaeoglobus veneficus SNP6]
MEFLRLPSGSRCIDSLLGGGFETGTITQIYGASATGKTSLCLMLAYNTALRFGKVAYIDTEGLSGERVKQIFEKGEVLKNVYIYDVFDFKQQSVAIKELAKLCRKEEVRLVIVDSFTALYRSELEDERAVQMKRELVHQLTFLLGLARKYGLAVVITNQMFTDVKTGEDKPLGGPSIDHLSKVILALERSNSERKATLVKHRSKPEGESCTFRITDRGLEP